MKARIVEIFSSIQGEGLWVGKPQVFVRFHGCQLKCRYCDTPTGRREINTARIEYPPYSKRFEEHPLEFTIDGLNREVERFGIPSLAITGGEPLEQVAFLQQWLPSLTGQYEVLLETNGLESVAVARVLSFVDMVSMDIKLPSTTGGGSFWQEHDEFIKVVMHRPCFAKIVFDETITDDEMEQVFMIGKRYPRLILFFQPMAPLRERDLTRCLSIFQVFSNQFSSQVRFLPQIHPFLSVM